MIYICLIIILTVVDKSKEFDKDSIQRKLPLVALNSRSSTDMVVSTLPLRFSLCKLASSADRKTKTELMHALGIDNQPKLKSCYEELKETLRELDQVDLIFLNKIYVNYTDAIDANFITNSNETSAVQVDKVGFNYPEKAASFINKWIDVASFKRITDIVNVTDISQDTAILLLSAVYFKTSWEFPFDIRLTKDATFHHVDRSISSIPMMTKTDSFLYFDDYENHLQILNMKLDRSSTSVTFVLPQDMSYLPFLLEKITQEPNFLKNLKDKMQYTDVNVFLPRFKIKTTYDWTDSLLEFVSKRIFNKTDSGLKGILKKNSKIKNIHLSKAKQKNFFILDEMGVFRQIAALRSPYMQEMTTEPVPSNKDFVADRPFYFTIDLEPLSGRRYELLHGVFYGKE